MVSTNQKTLKAAPQAPKPSKSSGPKSAAPKPAASQPPEASSSTGKRKSRGVEDTVSRAKALRSGGAEEPVDEEPSPATRPRRSSDLIPKPAAPKQSVPPPSTPKPTGVVGSKDPQTPGRVKCKELELAKGDVVQALYPKDKSWQKAEVLDINLEEEAALVHFISIRTRFDHWIEFDLLRPSTATPSGSKEAVDLKADFKIRGKRRLNDEHCSVCFVVDGLRLCCSGQCLRTFHPECIGIEESQIPEGDWFCQACSKGFSLCGLCRKEIDPAKGDPVGCTIGSCPELYHQECIMKSMGLSKPPGPRVYCPRHTCRFCGVGKNKEKNPQRMNRCILCPSSYHAHCTPLALDAVLVPGAPYRLICSAHPEEVKLVRSYTPDVLEPSATPEVPPAISASEPPKEPEGRKSNKKNNSGSEAPTDLGEQRSQKKGTGKRKKAKAANTAEGKEETAEAGESIGDEKIGVDVDLVENPKPAVPLDPEGAEAPGQSNVTKTAQKEEAPRSTSPSAHAEEKVSRSSGGKAAATIAERAKAAMFAGDSGDEESGQEVKSTVPGSARLSMSVKGEGVEAANRAAQIAGGVDRLAGPSGPIDKVVDGDEGTESESDEETRRAARGQKATDVAVEDDTEDDDEDDVNDSKDSDPADTSPGKGPEGPKATIKSSKTKGEVRRRVTTGYQVFSREKRPELQRQHPSATPQEMKAMIVALYASLPVHVREDYKQIAKQKTAKRLGGVPEDKEFDSVRSKRATNPNTKKRKKRTQDGELAPQYRSGNIVLKAVAMEVVDDDDVCVTTEPTNSLAVAGSASSSSVVAPESWHSPGVAPHFTKHFEGAPGGWGSVHPPIPTAGTPSNPLGHPNLHPGAVESMHSPPAKMSASPAKKPDKKNGGNPGSSVDGLLKKIYQETVQKLSQPKGDAIVPTHTAMTGDGLPYEQHWGSIASSTKVDEASIQSLANAAGQLHRPSPPSAGKTKKQEGTELTGRLNEKPDARVPSNVDLRAPDGTPILTQPPQMDPGSQPHATWATDVQIAAALSGAAKGHSGKLQPPKPSVQPPHLAPTPYPQQPPFQNQSALWWSSGNNPTPDYLNPVGNMGQVQQFSSSTKPARQESTWPNPGPATKPQQDRVPYPSIPAQGREPGGRVWSPEEQILRNAMQTNPQFSVQGADSHPWAPPALPGGQRAKKLPLQRLACCRTKLRPSVPLKNCEDFALPIEPPMPGFQYEPSGYPGPGLTARKKRDGRSERARWTVAEEAELLNAVNIYGQAFNLILSKMGSRFHPTRTAYTLRMKWRRLKQQPEQDV